MRRHKKKLSSWETLLVSHISDLLINAFAFVWPTLHRVFQ